MKAFMDERNLDLIFLAVFRSLFQYTVLIVFYGRNEEEAEKEIDGEIESPFGGPRLRQGCGPVQ